MIMGGVDVFGFIGGSVVVGGSGGTGGIVGVVVGVVVVVVTLLRRFGLNLLRRSSRSDCIFWACVRGGVAGLAHGGSLDLFAEVLVVGEAVAVVIPSHGIVVGVLSGVGEGGMHGSAHKDLARSDVVGRISAC